MKPSPQTLRALVLIVFFALLYLLPYLGQSDSIIVPASGLGTDLVTDRWSKLVVIKTVFDQDKTLPFWTDSQLAGQPLLGSPTSLLLYPPLALILFLSLPQALMGLYLLHLILAGFGMYGLLYKSYKVQWFSAAIAALCYMLMPKTLAHLAAGHIDIVFAMAWVPWIMWGVRSAIINKRWLGLPLTGLALALQLICHSQIAFYTVFLVGLYALFQVIAYKQNLLRVVAQLAVLGAASMLCLAAQFVPLLQLWQYMTRSQLSLTDANYWPLPLALWATQLALPNFQFPEWTVYPGLLVILLVPLAWKHPARRDVLFWLAVALFGLVYALGITGGLFTVFFTLVPGFSFFRVPPRMLMLLDVAGPILLALSLDSLATQRIAGAVKLWRRGLLVIGFGAAITVAFVLIVAKEWPINVVWLVVLLPLVALIPLVMKQPRLRWLLLLLVMLDLVRIGWWHSDIVPRAELLALPAVLSNVEPTGRIFLPRGGIGSGVLAEHGFTSLDGADPFQLDYSTTAIDTAAGCPQRQAVSVVPTCGTVKSVQLPLNLIRAFQVTQIVLPTTVTVAGLPAQSSAEANGLDLYNVENPIPRAHVVWGTVPTKTPLDSVNFEQVALTDGQYPELAQDQALAPPPVHTIHEDSHDLEYSVALSQPGLFVLADTWSPGWQATVDGVPTPIARVNISQRGILLAAGAHTIVMQYLPSGVAWAFWLSAIAALSAIVLWIIGMQKTRGMVRE